MFIRGYPRFKASTVNKESGSSFGEKNNNKQDWAVYPSQIGLSL
jgi:hypothetical protein